MFDKIMNKKNDTNVTLLNNQKGVTIIMLIIAIVMMLIIVSFAVFNAPKTTTEAKLAEAYTSLKGVKNACESALNLIEINPSEYDEYYFFGHTAQYNIDNNIINDINLNEAATKFGLASANDFSSRTYIIKPAETEEEKRVLENLELKNMSSTYIVDLENEKYYLLDGIERSDGNTLYEYKEILMSYEMLTN